MSWTVFSVLLNRLIEKQNSAIPRDLSASGFFQTFHPTSRENCIYTSGRWKSYIHLSTREEILACLAMAALSACFQIAEEEGASSEEGILLQRLIGFHPRRLS